MEAEHPNTYHKGKYIFLKNENKATAVPHHLLHASVEISFRELFSIKWNTYLYFLKQNVIEDWEIFILFSVVVSLETGLAIWLQFSLEFTTLPWSTDSWD